MDIHFSGIGGYILYIIFVLTAVAITSLGAFLLWSWFILEVLLKKVLQSFGLYRVFLEFIFDRSKYKNEKNKKSQENIIPVQYKGTLSTDIVKFIFTYIPNFITVDDKEYYFRMYVNHPHYDFRICYDSGLQESGACDFKYLIENIGSEDDLIFHLIRLRKEMQADGVLQGSYATIEGYTYQKYQENTSGF